MSCQPSTTTWWKPAAILLLLTLFWCLFISPTSPLYEVCVKRDITWWYMCGKAWAEGLTPYVDFADSKGPLLWLYYMVAYLISPHSYVGSFWLEIPLTFACLCLLYAMAGLYVREPRWRLVATVVTGMFLFAPTWYYHMRAETLCMPFLLGSVYLALKAGKGELQHLGRAAFWLGVGCSWAFLIKYNLTVLVAAAWPFLFLAAWKQRTLLSALLKTGFGAVLGAAALLIPFALWGWHGQWLMPCIQEYLINTAGTISQMHSGDLISMLVQKCAQSWLRPSSVFALVCLMGVVAFAREKGEPLLFRLAPLVLFLVYVAVIWPVLQAWIYYTIVIIPFCLMPVCWVVRALQGIQLSRGSLVMMLGVFALLPVCAQEVCMRPGFCLNQIDGESFWYREAVAHEINSPKVLCLGHENGFGITAGSLPACRYWSKQSGCSAEMEQARLEAIRAGIPDFVEGVTSGLTICYNGDYSSLGETQPRDISDALRQGGYHEVYRNFMTGEIVYGKKDALPRSGYEKRRLREILLKQPRHIDENTWR